MDENRGKGAEAWEYLGQKKMEGWPLRGLAMFLKVL